MVITAVAAMAAVIAAVVVIAEGIITAVIVTTVALLASGVVAFGVRVTGVPVTGPATGAPVGDPAGAGITEAQWLDTRRLLLRRGCGSKVTRREPRHLRLRHRPQIPTRNSGGIGASVGGITILT